MGLKYVYIQDILNTTMVVVLEVLFMDFFFIEMSLPMSKIQVKESQSRAVSLIFTQAGVGV